MELTTAEIGNEITKISLSGRLDIDGALKIDGPFMDIVKEKKFVAVDLSDVGFLASLGMRTLVSGAKASWEHGGRMVLLKPAGECRKSFKVGGYRYDHSDRSRHERGREDLWTLRRG